MKRPEVGRGYDEGMMRVCQWWLGRVVKRPKVDEGMTRYDEGMTVVTRSCGEAARGRTRV